MVTRHSASSWRISSQNSGKKTELFDAVAYSQFFEIYGEAITLQYLRSRPGLQAGRVEESKVPGEGRPDFVCKCDGGEIFYVEVKSLDIVSGEFRHREMMNDALDVQIELEERRKKGGRVAFAEGTIDPYTRTLGETQGYDPRSLKRVIDTLRISAGRRSNLAQLSSARHSPWP